jgi:hypothetical protein
VLPLPVLALLRGVLVPVLGLGLVLVLVLVLLPQCPWAWQGLAADPVFWEGVMPVACLLQRWAPFLLCLLPRVPSLELCVQAWAMLLALATSLQSRELPLALALVRQLARWLFRGLSRQPLVQA